MYISLQKKILSRKRRKDFYKKNRLLAPTFWIRNWNDYKLSRLRATPRVDYSYFNLFQHCSDFLPPKKGRKEKETRGKNTENSGEGITKGRVRHHRGCSSGNQSVLEKFDGFLSPCAIFQQLWEGIYMSKKCRRREGKDAPRILLARIAPRIKFFSFPRSETILLSGKKRRTRRDKWKWSMMILLCVVIDLCEGELSV